MIGPSGTVRVMVATKAVDFRKGAEGLAALVRETMMADPFSAGAVQLRSISPVDVPAVTPVTLPGTARVVVKPMSWKIPSVTGPGRLEISQSCTSSGSS